MRDGTSLYDHFGSGFTLLVTNGEAQDGRSLAEAAGALSVPLLVLAPGDPRFRDNYQARFALIRPDQYVAWRGDAIPAAPDELLARVTGSATEYAADRGLERMEASA